MLTLMSRISFLFPILFAAAVLWSCAESSFRATNTQILGKNQKFKPAVSHGRLCTPFEVQTLKFEDLRFEDLRFQD
jgi:hypothetical protein